jgi:hypothetical protein
VPIPRGVSQISPPIRILLVLTVAVLGVYMLFLRPKAPTAEPAPPQTGAVSQPGKAVEAAKGAVDATDKQLQSEESVDGVDSGEAAAGTTTGTKAGNQGGAPGATANGVDLKGLPKPVARAIRKDKTLVLLFWNGKSADDKAVHKAVQHVDRWDGRVYVGTASIKKIAKYGLLARGVDVEQSPTVVVVDSELHAETLVGYVDRLTIDQAVVDAFRYTTGVFTDPYLRKVDAVCRDYRGEINQIPHSLATTVPQFMHGLDRANDIAPRFAADFAAVKAPAKWRAFRKATVADNAAVAAYYAGLAQDLGSHPSRVGVVTALAKRESKRVAINKSYRPRMMHARLTRCVS